MSHAVLCSQAQITFPVPYVLAIREINCSQCTQLQKPKPNPESPQIFVAGKVFSLLFFQKGVLLLELMQKTSGVLIAMQRERAAGRRVCLRTPAALTQRQDCSLFNEYFYLGINPLTLICISFQRLFYKSYLTFL